jgi:hypothetical protein
MTSNGDALADPPTYTTGETYHKSLVGVDLGTLALQTELPDIPAQDGVSLSFRRTSPDTWLTVHERVSQAITLYRTRVTETLDIRGYGGGGEVGVEILCGSAFAMRLLMPVGFQRTGHELAQ